MKESSIVVGGASGSGSPSGFSSSEELEDKEDESESDAASSTLHRSIVEVVEKLLVVGPAMMSCVSSW